MSWNESFFNDLYQELFMTRTEEQIQEIVNIITKETNINNGSIIDFCCGIGDILNEFKNRGFSTYGVDYSDSYIQTSKKLYNLKETKQGDAVSYNFNIQSDITLNWNSSFGYFNDETNKVFLNNIYQHTKENGFFVLEIYNTYDILKNYQEKICYKKPYKNTEIEIERVSKINMDERTLEQEWVFNHNNENKKYNTKTKLYFVDEIIKMMNEVGFKNIKYNEYTSQFNNKNNNMKFNRILVVGQK